MYHFKSIESLGGSYSYGRALNDAEQVVGDSYLTGDKKQHAFLMHQNATNDIGTHFPELNSVANAINNHGMIVGTYAKQPALYTQKINQAFIFDYKSKQRIDLGSLGGPSSFAYGINDKDQTVGYAKTADGADHAFLFDINQSALMKDLGTLGGLNSVATAINHSGQVVGYSSVNTVDTHAFIYEDNMMKSIGTLGGSCSFANAINDYGQVVGSAYDKQGNDRAFLYDADSRPCMKDLGSLGGAVSIANGINNAGQVVGYSFIKGDTDARAFLYHNEQMIDLNSLLDNNAKQSGWILNEALAINNNGSIVGVAYNNNADIPSCAFLLTVDQKATKSYVKFLTNLSFTFSLTSKKSN